VYGHGAIVRSSHTKALEYAFLRDGPESCAGGWDVAGPLIGRAVGFVEAHIPAAYHFAEKAVARKTVGSATTGLDAVGSVRAVMKVGAGTLQRAVSDIGGPLVRGAGPAARALRSVLGRVAEPL
jgi:hypothetical protein